MTIDTHTTMLTRMGMEMPLALFCEPRILGKQYLIKIIEPVRDVAVVRASLQ